MGYYTDFELKAKYDGSSPIYISKLENEVDKLNIFECGSYSENWYANDKWYDFDKDMILLSSRFPEVLFELRGQGEESGDIWLNYYKGGGVMRDCLTIKEEPFDESKVIKVVCASEKYSYE